MLNIDELIIINIILNYQINRPVTYIVSCYTITNWVTFEFVIIDMLIIHIVFELEKTIEIIDTVQTPPVNTNYHLTLQVAKGMSYDFTVVRDMSDSSL